MKDKWKFSATVIFLSGFLVGTFTNFSKANLPVNQRWEYKFLVDKDSGFASSELVNKVCAEEGWEVVAVPSLSGSTTIFLLRRPRR